MKKIIILASLFLLIGVGCGETETSYLTADSFSQKDWHIICLSEKNDKKGCIRIPKQNDKINELEEKLEMLIEAGGFVDWEIKNPVVSSIDGCGRQVFKNETKTTLTNDKNKVEYMELECDKVINPTGYVFIPDEEIHLYERCKELKSKFNPNNIK